MKRVIIILITLSVLAFSCDDNEFTITDTFEVTVAGFGADCGLVLIDFKENDLESIKNITGFDWIRYHAYNLDKDKFSEVGQKLIVTVRKTRDNELFPCTTMGPGYPWVTITNVDFGNCNITSICNETPPTDEICTAYFTMWFYDKTTSACNQIGYSGCSKKGFETKKECESCKCNTNGTGG
ncbi:MAG: BPTI/Kunitz-type proteinase inhibitor domain-containing protein [Candidatus Cyclobacteriaceae bacterium M2_1C_046]